MISGHTVLPSRPFSADELREFLHSHSDCERIHLFSEPSLAEVCTEFGFVRRGTRNTVSLDLTQTEEFLWADMDAKRRNGIRYARKHGVVFRIATMDDLDDGVSVFVNGYCVKYNYSPNNVRVRVENWITRSTYLLARLGADGPTIAGTVFRDGNYDNAAAAYFQKGIYGVYATNTSLVEYQKYKPNDLLV